MSFITSFCHINNTTCSVNGQTIAEFDPEAGDSWLKQLYKNQEIVYPKYYKMDTTSQVGFIAAELLKRAHSLLWGNYQDDEVAMVFASSSASADTDTRFQKSYQQENAPSPSLFVYTLPNIVIGEIAIFNKWYGENMCVVLPKFAPDFFVDYTRVLFSQGSEAVLAGWLEMDSNRINAFVFFVEKQGDFLTKLSTDNLQKIAGESFKF